MPVDNLTHRIRVGQFYNSFAVYEIPRLALNTFNLPLLNELKFKNKSNYILIIYLIHKDLYQILNIIMEMN